MDPLIIATRESPLALAQAKLVKAAIRELYPKQKVDLLGLTTRGDQVLDRTLSKVGGKGLFVKELEIALKEGRAHLAVHSLKDVPMNLPRGFTLAAIMEREDVRDAFVSNNYANLRGMPKGAKVGTASVRRALMLKRRFPKLEVVPVRGNVGTRLKKLDAGDFDALILAAAGLKRLKLEARIASFISKEVSLPAPGQGALGIEIRSSDDELSEMLAELDHTPTAICCMAERAVSRTLGGNCSLPLAANCEIIGGGLRLRAWLASEDGSKFAISEREGDLSNPEALGERVANHLMLQMR